MRTSVSAIFLKFFESGTFFELWACVLVFYCFLRRLSLFFYLFFTQCKLALYHNVSYVFRVFLLTFALNSSHYWFVLGSARNRLTHLFVTDIFSDLKICRQVHILTIFSLRFVRLSESDFLPWLISAESAHTEYIRQTAAGLARAEADPLLYRPSKFTLHTTYCYTFQKHPSAMRTPKPRQFPAFDTPASSIARQQTTSHPKPVVQISLQISLPSNSRCCSLSVALWLSSPSQ